MTAHRSMMPRIGAALRRGIRDESGTTLVEFAIVVAIFLLILFGLIDFGRLGYSWVMAEKAMQRAARIAAVRPPMCANVPAINLRDPDSSISPAPRLGISCSPGVCAASFQQCTGGAANATAPEVWDEIEASIGGLMPSNATMANVQFTYESDPNLGFLGGPYTPAVTAELVGVTFQFTSPLGGLATMAGATGAGLPMQITMPAMSVSLPAEDLAQGNAG